MKIKSDHVTAEALSYIKEQLQDLFPYNQVFVFGMGQGDDMEFTRIREFKEINENKGCSTENYCVDCDCGKKKQAQTE